MRRRRRKSHTAGLVIGAAFFGGLLIVDWTAVPELQPQPARLEADASQTPPGPVPPENVAIATVAISEPPTLPSPSPAAMVEARPGDTPLKLLARVGVAPEDAQEAARMLARVWNPRDLRRAG